MGLEITVGGKSLLLPRGFEIEWEENNYAFEDDSIFGDYSIPLEVSIKGNEQALNFVHEINTANKPKVLEDARCYDNGNLLYTGALAVIKANRLRASISFLVHDIAYFFGKKKLNELDLPEVVLGADDAAVLAEAAASINDDTKLYCFPPIKADNFYGEDAGFPASINGNSHNGSEYSTSDTFSKPLIPFFRLLNFLEFLINAAGYAMTGNIRQYPQFYYPVISNMASLDRSKNPNDVSYSLETHTLTNSTVQWQKSLGHIASNFGPLLPECKVEVERKFAVDFNLNLPDYSSYSWHEGYLINFKIDVRLVLADDEYGFVNREIVATPSTYESNGGPFYGNDTLSGNHRITHTATAAQVGKYVFLEIKGQFDQYVKTSGGIYDPFPTYSFRANSGWRFPNCSPSFAIRYFGEGGSLLIDNKLDWSFLLPDKTAGEFFSDLKNDFNFRFVVHPFRKEVEVNLAKDLLRAPIKKLTPFVNRDFEYNLNSKVKGYSFKQEIDNEVDEEKEEALKYRKYLGSFDGPANFPDAQLNAYVVDAISDEVYIGTFGSQSHILDFTFTAEWELSHQRVKSVEATGGSESREITAAFKPLLSKKNGADYELFYSGTGKSKYSLSKPDQDGFMIVNFFGKEAGWDAPYASRTNYYKDGTLINGAMVLNYDPEDVNSIYSVCWKVFIDFMLRRLELELVLLHQDLKELDLGYRYEIGGRLFLIAQVRKLMGVNGLRHLEATAYQIN